MRGWPRKSLRSSAASKRKNVPPSGKPHPSPRVRRKQTQRSRDGNLARVSSAAAICQPKKKSRTSPSAAARGSLPVLRLRIERAFCTDIGESLKPQVTTYSVLPGGAQVPQLRVHATRATPASRSEPTRSDGAPCGEWRIHARPCLALRYRDTDAQGADDPARAVRGIHHSKRDPARRAPTGPERLCSQDHHRDRTQTRKVSGQRAHGLVPF